MTQQHDHQHAGNHEHEGHEHEGHHDPTFYRSPRDAAAAPKERLAYVATFARPAGKPDAIAVAAAT